MFIFMFSSLYLVDRPLIVQFAAKCAKDLADATEIIVPYVQHLCIVVAMMFIPIHFENICDLL